MDRQIQESDRQDRIIEAFQGYAAAQSDLGREFARCTGQHPTDAVAMVEILRAEARQSSMTPARLAQRIGLTSGATSILLNRLEDAGHITRQRGHPDRRTVTLHATPEIHVTAGSFFEPLREHICELLDRRSDEELNSIESFVTQLRDTVVGYMSSLHARDAAPHAEFDPHQSDQAGRSPRERRM